MSDDSSRRPSAQWPALDSARQQPQRSAHGAQFAPRAAADEPQRADPAKIVVKGFPGAMRATVLREHFCELMAMLPAHLQADVKPQTYNAKTFYAFTAPSAMQADRIIAALSGQGVTFTAKGETAQLRVARDSPMHIRKGKTAASHVWEPLRSALKDAGMLGQGLDNNLGCSGTAIYLNVGNRDMVILFYIKECDKSSGAFSFVANEEGCKEVGLLPAVINEIESYGDR